MKVAPAIRIVLTVLGIALVIIAFVAVVGFGAATNPPTLRVAVAVRDLNAGDQLSSRDYRIVEQIIDPGLARLYVQEGELPTYEGAYVVDSMRRGDPLNKVKLAAGDSAGVRRYALVLTDSNDVVMVLPANPDIIPNQISTGDFVNILFAGGAEVGINQLPDATQTPQQQSLGIVTTVPASTPVPASQITVTQTPTPTATPRIVLPMSDLMLERVPVLAVNYQQIQNPDYGAGGTNTDRPFLDGPITSIVVRVPRAYQTLLGFAVAASKLRFAIASPLLTVREVRPQLGVDWQAYMDMYRWKQMQTDLRGETLTRTLFPLYTPIAPQVVVAPAANVLPTPAALPVPGTPAPTPTSANR
jgi:hypothetical protein